MISKIEMTEKSNSNPADSIKPYGKSDKSKKEEVAQMFDNISENYDQLNRMISFGADIKWRKKVLKMVKEARPTSILDIATGTGDLAILFAESEAKRIVGLDISVGMLDVGKQKIKDLKLDKRIEMLVGDSENLPFDDHSFDVVTVSFGIRNFENLEKGLGEILRVLSPKGQLIVLETSVPDNFPFKQGYYIHSKVILPAIGKLFSKDKRAYSYLSESASAFPYGQKLCDIFQKVGFSKADFFKQTMGVATIYQVFK
jgi:demethylmenaquinone methyltransferase/2-methoxy-6-polyprenyl-1,4-benzoquinol methylase